jgi:hypothetical protein
MPTTLTVFHSNLVPLTELISTDCALLLAASHLTKWGRVMFPFRDRTEAGRLLAETLRE